MLYDIYFSRINVDRQLQRRSCPILCTRYFSRINVDRQLQRRGFAGNLAMTLAGSMWTGNYNPVAVWCRVTMTLAGSMWTGNYNVSSYRSGPLCTLAGSMWTGNYNLFQRQGASLRTLAGSMWTGNYNQTEQTFVWIGTLAGSMWTGNYNCGVRCWSRAWTLAGSMWTGNYNGVAGGRRRGAERRRRGVRHQPEKSALGRGWGAGGKGNTSRASRGVPLPPVNLPPPSPRISTNLPQAAQLLDALRRRG